jgi:hypothetical protein
MVMTLYLRNEWSDGWQSPERRRPRSAQTLFAFSYRCRSGVWWSARLKRLSSCRDDKGSWRAIDALDWPRGETRRQGRRLPRERIADEIDDRADRAITIVIVVAGLLLARWLRVRLEADNLGFRITAANAVEMDVPERHDHLQRQRKQRKPAPETVTKQEHSTHHLRAAKCSANVARCRLKAQGYPGYLDPKRRDDVDTVEQATNMFFSDALMTP